MDIYKKLSVLKRIADEFNKNNVSWALGASGLLYFKGLVKDFNDIDILIVKKDTDAVRNIMMKLGTLKAPNPDTKYKTEEFLEYIIDEVEVDVMAGFIIVCNNDTYDCSLKKEQIVEYHDLKGTKIPLQSLELWCRYYELMGRDNKVNIIKNSLGKE